MTDVTKSPELIASSRRSRRLALESPMDSSKPATTAGEAVASIEPRRNPKRKTSEANTSALNLPTDLLTAVYEPLADGEREDWEGWVELESDPASFSYILNELGVKGVEVQELFSIDQDSLNLLPKPVHGLIFLFQYQPEHVIDDESTQGDDVWFANQTSHNACATVALLNIAMNTEGVQLGEKLRDFKAETMSLSAPLRGDRITVNSFIRSKHNSFASRIDLLDADLGLESDFLAAERMSKRRASPKKGKGKSGLRRGEEYAFHFIAYVAAKGSVWELDGLRPQPTRLGPITTEDWTTVATPQIEARIMQYAESQLAFNLLALCQTPQAAQRRRIVESVASLRYIRSHMSSVQEFERLISGEEQPLDVTNPSQLAEYDLQPRDVDESAALPSVVEKLRAQSLEVNDAYELYHNLTQRARQAMASYDAERSNEGQGPECLQTMKAPWSPAIHRLLTALAEKDALLGLLRNS